MGRRILFILVAEALVLQVMSANLHPALQQYILGLSQPTPSISYPSVSMTKQTSPQNMHSLAALASLLASPAMPVKQSVPKSPSSLLTALVSEHSANSASNSNLQSLLALASSLSPAKPQTLSPNSLITALSEPVNPASGVDASLLNNLAIALQLLLVSNIINTPQQEAASEPLVVPGYPIDEFKETVAPMAVSYAHPGQQSQPVAATTMPARNPNYMPHYEHSNPSYNSNYNHYEVSNYPSHMPNANFVGGSSLTDSNPFGGTIPHPSSSSSSRGGFSLMSPYEALGPASPYSDPILSSPFGSVMTSKKDFQSPYSSIMAADNKDLFSMSDFF